jgi:hypothetical protein
MSDDTTLSSQSRSPSIHDPARVLLDIGVSTFLPSVKARSYEYKRNTIQKTIIPLISLSQSTVFDRSGESRIWINVFKPSGFSVSNLDFLWQP